MEQNLFGVLLERLITEQNVQAEKLREGEREYPCLKFDRFGVLRSH